MTTDIEIERIVGGWIARLRDAHAEHASEDLLEAYRPLGRIMLGEAADMGFGVSTRSDEEERRSVERVRSGVVAALRREALPISRPVEDLHRLIPIACEELGSTLDDAGTSDGSEFPLRLSNVVDRSLFWIVRAMEAAAIRAERERAQSVAAFADQLSHELENRLGAARTAAHMLRPSALDIETVDLARIGELVDASIEAALRTVQDVRDLVVRRVRSDDRKTRTMPLPLLVRTVLDDLGPIAFETGVEVTMADEIVACDVDSPRLRLIVYNLVGNGIKYHDPGKDLPFVHVEATADADDRVVLTVSDNGLGIPDDEVDDIFLPRWRGGDRGDLPGTGLGLAIVREAVDQLGGDIEVSSEVSVGTTFTLTFEPARWPADTSHDA